MVAIDEQSPDISQGVSQALEVRTDVNDDDVLDLQGAGDQGMMFGFACDETPELMPLPISLAHKLARRLAEVRKAEILPYLRPDGKSQVTVRYEDGKPVEIVKVVLASQHAESADLQSIIYPDLLEHVVEPILPKGLYDATKLEDITVINATGKFVIGGPMGDCGLTGRKIVVDTYGGAAPHGGGAFSGKDPSKVDRSGAYAARYVAKNVVAAGLADALPGAGGLRHRRGPPGLGDGRLPGHREGRAGHHRAAHRRALRPAAGRHPSRPRPAPAHLPKTAAYGHFGRHDHDFTWERTDKAEALRAAAGLRAADAAPARARDGGVAVSYAAVFPLVRTRAFAEAFDYSVPAELEGRGSRGRARRRAARGADGHRRRPRAARRTTAHEGRVLPAARPARRPAHPRRPAGAGASRSRRYYLTSFAAALALVCPPTGALKVVRQYELTAGGRAACEAGEEALDEVAGLKLPGGAAGEARRAVPPQGLGAHRLPRPRAWARSRRAATLRRGGGDPARAWGRASAPR